MRLKAQEKLATALFLSASGIVSGTSGCRAKERPGLVLLEALQSNGCRIRIESGPSNVVFLTIPPLVSGAIS